MAAQQPPQPEQQRPPTWLQCSFWGECCDSYAEATLLEQGRISISVASLMEAYKALADSAADALPLFGPPHVQALRGLEDVLKECGKLASALEVCISTRMPFTFMHGLSITMYAMRFLRKCLYWLCYLHLWNKNGYVD